jgi:hypothetical protein
MSGLDARLLRLESAISVLAVEVTADLLYLAFDDLGLAVAQPPMTGESFTEYLNRCPLDAVLAVVRKGFHGIRH